MKNQVSETEKLNTWLKGRDWLSPQLDYALNNYKRAIINAEIAYIRHAIATLAALQEEAANMRDDKLQDINGNKIFISRREQQIAETEHKKMLSRSLQLGARYTELKAELKAV